MIVNKTRRLVIRMGQYESHEVIANVTLDTNNEDDRALIADYDSDPVRSTAIFMDETLDEFVFSDVEDAHMNTDDSESFIHTYHAEITKRSK